MTPKNTPKPYIVVFYCVFYALLDQLWTFLAQNWASGRWNVDLERPGENLRFFQHPDTKMGPSGMSWKCNFSAFWINQFGEIFKKSSRFSKTALSTPFRALRARKSENPAIEAHLGLKSCNRNPPQGVRDPITSSAWTSKRALTGSYASLLKTPLQQHRFISLLLLEGGGARVLERASPTYPGLPPEIFHLLCILNKCG